jgi:hypothetical protein
MTTDARVHYDQALGLRYRARTDLETASTAGSLIQANEDAAQAVLALQGVMKALEFDHPLVSSLDGAPSTCFYCGRDDRPPYIRQTIDDGKGESMDVQICTICTEELQQGLTPRIATMRSAGVMVPWWAVPNNPWYSSYGGSAWQYWLPFLVGMDVGGWFGGGWHGGLGWYGPEPEWNDGSSLGGGSQVPSDAGGAETGSWGGDSGGADSGGSG